MSVRNVFFKVLCCVLMLSIALISMTACSEEKDFNTKESKNRNKTSQSAVEDENLSDDDEQSETTEISVKQVEDDTNEYSTEGAVHKTERADPSYFDDAVFVGDSISFKLEYYERTEDKLGKAQFLTVGSMSANNVLMPLGSENSIHPKYQGEEMMVEDAVKATGAKKMYIMLGMNDISYGLDYSIKNYKQVIDNIVGKSPDLTVLVQSVTPRLSSNPTVSPGITNEKVKEYNKKISDMCKENGWYFVDVASVMYDPATGCLYDSYCSDKESMGMHFTDEGCSAWTEYLFTHIV